MANLYPLDTPEPSATYIVTDKQRYSQPEQCCTSPVVACEARSMAPLALEALADLVYLEQFP